MSRKSEGRNTYRRRLWFVWHGVTAAIKQPAPSMWTVAQPGRGAEFEGQVVVIVGAAGKVGAPMVEAFLRAGATVHALDVDREGLDRARDAIPPDVGVERLTSRVLDLGDDAEVRSFAATIDSVDVLVQSAVLNDGVGDPGDITSDSLRRMFDVNVIGPTALTSALVDALAAGGRGSVVFVTSIHSTGASRWAQYGAVKGTLRKLTADLAGSLAERGIRVNAVAPGWTLDGSLDADERVAITQPLGWATVPIEAVLHAVMFLADRDRSPMTTGQELVVDGGSTLHPKR